MTDENKSDYSTTDTLAIEMRCGIFTNAEGDVMIVHDKEFKEPIQWIEYNQGDNQMFLIYESGAMQDFGVQIDNEMQEHLLHGVKVSVVHLKDKKIQSTQNVVLLIQQY